MTLYELAQYSSGSSVGDGGIAHRGRGTVYGEGAAIVYSHGPDGDKLLNPVIDRLLEDLVHDGTLVADLGCGSGNEALRCAQLGGRVFALDFQESMVEVARDKASERGLEERVQFAQGDASDLSSFPSVVSQDVAMSVLVGCNLPKGVFEGSFSEMGRVLRPGARAIVVIPSSLERVFTKGETREAEAKAEIRGVLAELPDDPSPEEIEAKLKTLTEVNSATFVMDGHRLVLVEDLKQLKDGVEIWRKLPDLVIPNRYWSMGAYAGAFGTAGLTETDRIAPTMVSSVKRRVYNLETDARHRLGEVYEKYPIFTTLVLQKGE